MVGIYCSCLFKYALVFTEGMELSLYRQSVDPEVIAPSGSPQICFSFVPAGAPPGIRQLLGLHVRWPPGLSAERSRPAAAQGLLSHMSSPLVPAPVQPELGGNCLPAGSLRGSAGRNAALSNQGWRAVAPHGHVPLRAADATPRLCSGTRPGLASGAPRRKRSVVFSKTGQ